MTVGRRALRLRGGVSTVSWEKLVFGLFVFVLILFLSLLLVLGMFLILSNAKITEILQFFGYLGLSYS